MNWQILIDDGNTSLLPRLSTLPAINTPVICNGFLGTVVRNRHQHDSAWMGNMVEVMLKRGLVCVDWHDLREAD